MMRALVCLLLACASLAEQSDDVCLGDACHVRRHHLLQTSLQLGLGKMVEDLPEAHLQGLHMENMAPAPSGLGGFPEVKLPHHITKEQEEEVFNSLPDQMLTNEQQEELDRDGGAVEGFCGNSVVEEGEDCDSENPCCTAQCKFAPATVKCHQSADPCDVGGFCAGDSMACREQVVSPGTACPNAGKCFRSTCASRVLQCSEARLGDPCDMGCELLACKNQSGDCITVGDVGVLPGTPCDDDGQCSPEGTCISTAALPRDGVTSHSLIEIPQANRTALSLASWDYRSSAPEFLGFKVCYVVSRVAHRKGYDHNKILELNAFMDLVYRQRSKIPIQFTEPQIIVDHAGELDDIGQAGLGEFSVWAQRKRFSGAIGADVDHVQFLGGFECGGSSGRAYLGKACDPALGIGITVVADRNDICGGEPKEFAWRWGTIAHEIGHNLGMRHLWENTGAAQRATDHIMDYGDYSAWNFHAESKEDYHEHKARFACMTPLHPTGTVVHLQNVNTGRYLYAYGSNVRASRGLEGGWSVAPKVRAVDSNYYWMAKFVLIPAGKYVIIESYETGRVILGQGSSVKNKPSASEGGWAHAPPVVAADARYYELYLWERIDVGDSTFFKNAQTGRFLMAQGSPVWGKSRQEWAWLWAPEIVNSDANYYNLAAWKLRTA